MFLDSQERLSLGQRIMVLPGGSLSHSFISQRVPEYRLHTRLRARTREDSNEQAQAWSLPWWPSSQLLLSLIDSVTSARHRHVLGPPCLPGTVSGLEDAKRKTAQLGVLGNPASWVSHGHRSLQTEENEG